MCLDENVMRACTPLLLSLLTRKQDSFVRLCETKWLPWMHNPLSSQFALVMNLTFQHGFTFKLYLIFFCLMYARNSISVKDSTGQKIPNPKI